MQGLQKFIAEELLPKASLLTIAAVAGAAVNGVAVDTQNLVGGVTGLPVRFNSVMAVLAAEGILQSGNTLTVSAIKLQGSADSAFTTPIDLVTQTTLGGANTLTLTGTATPSTIIGQLKMGLDLTSIAQTTRYLRITATPTLSNVTSSSGTVTGLLVFGGGNEIAV